MWITAMVGRLMGLWVVMCVCGVVAALTIGAWLTPAEGILGYAHYPTGRVFGNLYLLDLARHLQVRVAVGIPPFAAMAWSADGTKFIYADTDSIDYELYLLDLTQHRPDGRQAQVLTNNNEHDRYPQWSPDGLQVVFQAYRNGRSDLFTFDILSGQEQSIVSSQEFEYGPAWSADGQLIAFASIPTERGYGLYVLNLETQRVNYVADLPGESLVAWSPDGAHLAASPTDRVGLYRIDLGSRRPVELRDNLELTETGGRAVWSPDGTRLAFVSIHEGGGWIYLLNADGSALERITSDDGFSASPVWFP